MSKEIKCDIIICLEGGDKERLEKSLDVINLELFDLKSSINNFSDKGNQTVLIFNPKTTGIALYDNKASAAVIIWRMQLSQLLQLLEIKKTEEEIPVVSFKGDVSEQLNCYIDFMEEEK